MPKKLVMLTMTIVFMVSCVLMVQAEEQDGFDREEVPIKFSDADQAPWAKEYIGKMQSKDVIESTGDGTFKPYDDVSRAAAIVMVVRLLGLEDEAERKTDATLHFQDEENIPSWARGHVAVALENDLFNSNQKDFNPYEPAKRIWIAELLVKSLELGDEALEQMNDIPDFTDVDQIPAGAIGYVNVAAEESLTTGYSDGSFKPYKDVSRAEMTAFLQRTNDELLEVSGARTIKGTLSDVNMTSGESTADVEISGETHTFNIASDLAVQYKDRLIRADQLREDDKVTLVVQDGEIIEGRLLAQDHSEFSSGVIELEIEYERDDLEYELEYDHKDDEPEVELKDEFRDIYSEGDAAYSVVDSMELTHEMSREETLETVMNELDITEDDFDELEIEVKYKNGDQIEIKREPSLNPPEEVTDELAKIESFDLEIESIKDEKWDYDYELDDDEFEAEAKTPNDELEQDEVMEAISSLINNASITKDMDEQEVQQAVINALSLDIENVKEFELDVNYLDGYQVETEFEQNNEQSSENNGATSHDIAQFEFELELIHGDSYDYSMGNDDGEQDYEIQKETSSKETELEGSKAKKEIDRLFEHAELTSNMNREEVINSLLSAFSISYDEVKELDVNILFDNGQSIKGEIEE